LQKEFEGCEVYRAGGDEFMIIAPDMDDNEFEECVRSLRKRTAEPDGCVCFAIGTYIDDASNIKQAMSIADARMYEDKESFYKRHPDFAR
jgi:GGDEF domain-containing protein